MRAFFSRSFGGCFVEIALGGHHPRWCGRGEQFGDLFGGQELPYQVPLRVERLLRGASLKIRYPPSASARGPSTIRNQLTASSGREC